ncbi:MAG: prepilin-type N-terminal cleavage/methylation domain-containing protein [Planctomycetes bacterium]|nr:prepilin-type N-terminal cleavage/methylation domain-containing protein [Planctomycetota bacterium]
MRTFSRGFTVIEVLVAIALTMVVGWLVSLAFNNASQACRGVTATLDYRAKGAAIMDMLETDIANISQYCQSLPNNTQPAVQFLAFKTVLPRQRTHYHLGATFDTAKGDYQHNVVSVRWQFFPGDPATNAPASLYRAVSSTGDIKEAFTDYQTDMANVDCYSTTPTGKWNLSPQATGNPAAPNFARNSEGGDISAYLVTHTDIRNFTVTRIGADYAANGGAEGGEPAVAGAIPSAYRISFFLTNAPANVKSPLDASTVAEKEALAKYIWEFFDRTIATR